MILSYVPQSFIQHVKTSGNSPSHLAVLADIFRLNTLYTIMQAGSGHIGSSFSAMDIVTALWAFKLKNPNPVDINTDGDLYFSSKGHDAPGLYSVLCGLGFLPFEKLHSLRRLGGLPGHPDVHTPHMLTNTGALGMGIAKARGMSKAKRLKGLTGNAYVLCGDGELQEGQFWESLLHTANNGYGEITVIIDHNKLQSDTYVKNVSDLGDLEARLKAHNWVVKRIDGHNIEAFLSVLTELETITDKPKVIIADTVKGKGISVMEHTSLKEEFPLYAFHSGAPSWENYQLGVNELSEKINAQLNALNLPQLALETMEAKPRYSPQSPQKLINAYSQAIVKLGNTRKDVVALDADLMVDCGLNDFRTQFPERFIECGIAEQDMVSMAGGLALQGLLPIVHSFSCFLSTRPNEQVFNNATEETKIIYAGSLAGILPSGPGHSHQCIRDISSVGSIPGLTMMEPCCEHEVALSLEWAANTNPQSTYIRLTSIPVDIPFEYPKNTALEKGCGVELLAGKDIALIAYGPIPTAQAYKAAQQLAPNASVAVYNLPWLNTVDTQWLKQLLKQYQAIVLIENHYTQLGQSATIAQSIVELLPELPNTPLVKTIGLNGIAPCGQNDEILSLVGLDAESIVNTVKTAILPQLKQTV